MKNLGSKDFLGWHILKERIHTEVSRAFFHEGEIWWGALGANIGFEQNGKHAGFERPVLIFRKFNKEIFWGLPVTTRERRGRYYFEYVRGNKRFFIILTQIRLLDAKRLKRKIVTLTRAERDALDEKFCALLSRNERPRLRGVSEAEAVV